MGSRMIRMMMMRMRLNTKLSGVDDERFGGVPGGSL